jgi:hypothetical protein
VSRFLQSQLFEIGARDPWVFVGVSLLLLGVSALACYVPARRASIRSSPCGASNSILRAPATPKR